MLDENGYLIKITATISKKKNSKIQFLIKLEVPNQIKASTKLSFKLSTIHFSRLCVNGRLDVLEEEKQMKINHQRYFERIYRTKGDPSTFLQ